MAQNGTIGTPLPTMLTNCSAAISTALRNVGRFKGGKSNLPLTLTPLSLSPTQSVSLQHWHNLSAIKLATLPSPEYVSKESAVGLYLLPSHNVNLSVAYRP